MSIILAESRKGKWTENPEQKCKGAHHIETCSHILVVILVIHELYLKDCTDIYKFFVPAFYISSQVFEHFVLAYTKAKLMHLFKNTAKQTFQVSCEQEIAHKYSPFGYGMEKPSLGLVWMWQQLGRWSINTSWCIWVLKLTKQKASIRLLLHAGDATTKKSYIEHSAEWSAQPLLIWCSHCLHTVGYQKKKKKKRLL